MLNSTEYRDGVTQSTGVPVATPVQDVPAIALPLADAVDAGLGNDHSSRVPVTAHIRMSLFRRSRPEEEFTSSMRQAVADQTRRAATYAADGHYLSLFATAVVAPGIIANNIMQEGVVRAIRSINNG